MKVERASPCKVNFLLNVLGKRTDGFHELETLLYPVAFCDLLHFSLMREGITLICNEPSLAVDASNLVHRAAAAFLHASEITAGIQIHLHKRIPLAAGLGGGSSNAATTLLALNDLFGRPLGPDQLTALAAALGSDVPFFLQTQPALATGRGEQIQPLDFFPALRGIHAVLIHPGFGISTAWAYQQLPRFPGALNGQPGRAAQLISLLRQTDLRPAGPAFYNALEAPALRKYPVLQLIQEFARTQGATVTLMSGSGSTTFALFHEASAARRLAEILGERFGKNIWTVVVPL